MHQDLRHSLRLLLKSPGFAAVAVFSLALGIGANTAIFSLVNAVFLRALPAQDPESLVVLYTIDRKNPGHLACSYPNYEDFRDRNAVFSGLALYITLPLTLSGDGDPQPVVGQMVSGNYFSVLGVRPHLGRGFLPEEDRVPGAHPVAVLSHGFWTGRFGADPGAVGRILHLNGYPYRVVGVASRGFTGLNALTAPDVWIPAMMHRQAFADYSWFNQRHALAFIPFGRLKPGIGPGQAAAEMATLAAGLEREHPRENEGRSIALVPASQAAIHPNMRGNFVRAGGLMMTMVGLVLLIACANLASLLVTRTAGRRREIAIRLAMGAGRGRLARQLLSESLLLSSAGAALGLLLARWARDLLWAARPPHLQYGSFDISLDLRVLAFTALVTVLAGVLFGLAPAAEAARTDLNTELKERGSGSARGPLRRVLVGLQVAFAIMALAGAGLFLRSVHFAGQIDPGFETGRLLVIPFRLGPHGRDPEEARVLLRRAIERVESLPGVESAALGAAAPFGNFSSRTMAPEGAAPGSAGALVLINPVDPAYFATLGIPILRGRGFNSSDTGRVAVVNETAARRFWPEGAVGRRLRFAGETAPIEIVGIARDGNYLSLGEERRAMVYLPLQGGPGFSSLAMHARVGGDPAAVVAPARREILSLAPGVLASEGASMTQLIRRSLWAPRLGAGLLSSFGALALLLAAIGIYGVVSYSVSRRVREIGIRMALGAGPRDVLLQVLRESMLPVAAGMVAGGVAALAAARLVAGMLYGVSAADPAAFIGAALVLAAVALAASYLPARRAMRVDPVVSLREE